MHGVCQGEARRTASVFFKPEELQITRLARSLGLTLHIEKCAKKSAWRLVEKVSTIGKRKVFVEA